MKIPGFDPRKMQSMLKEAERQQDTMQKQLETIKVDASAGGGMVSVVMTGAKHLVSIKIDPDAVKDGDVEMLQDLIVAAINEANRKADEKGQDVLRSQMGGLLGGLGMNF